jgi:hypothetical protein
MGLEAVWFQPANVSGRGSCEKYCVIHGMSSILSIGTSTFVRNIGQAGPHHTASGQPLTG